MEIQNIREPIRRTAARPAQIVEGTAAGRPAADRMELSRNWIAQMETQRAQLAALLNGKDQDSGGILDYMETEEDKLDALSEQMKVHQKCLIIAMRIMKGKKVPPEDERYLMEHDPEGYKLAMALRRPPKKDEKECKSVLDDEDKQSGEASGNGEAPPAETGDGEPTASGGGEAAE